MSGEGDERLAVPGQRGPQGNQGNMGNQGNPGSQGGQGSRGAQGEQGERGERGAAGLSRTVRRALVYLFALSTVLGGFNLFWTAHEVHASQASIQAAQERGEAEQRQAGVILEQKLCTTFGKLAANMPPAGNPRKNPSRAYDQNQHAILDELGTDLGCK